MVIVSVVSAWKRGKNRRRRGLKITAATVGVLKRFEGGSTVLAVTAAIIFQERVVRIGSVG
jgi:hypothetical protein